MFQQSYKNLKKIFENNLPGVKIIFWRNFKEFFFQVGTKFSAKLYKFEKMFENNLPEVKITFLEKF